MMLNALTSAKPIIRAEAVARSVGGCGRAFSRARWPVRPHTRGRTLPTTRRNGTASTGLSATAARISASEPRPTSEAAVLRRR
jgi:hypothetical protein